MSNPFFSLIVATINRSEELANLLVSLQRQTYKNFNVIIVDQNSDLRVTNVISNFRNRFDILHIRTNKRGASRARNLGVNVAQGDIVTFPDDDCEYPHDLLANVRKILSENTSYDGLSVSSRDKSRPGSIARFDRRRKLITKYNVLKCCIEFGIFIKRRSLGNTRFDEDLGVGASTPWWSDEGPDLLITLMNQNRRFLYVPDLQIFHPDPVWRYDNKAVVRSQQYGRGRGRFLRKHHYPFWFVIYVWGLYLAGVGIGVTQLNPGKVRYFWKGLQGRISGYYR